MAEKILIIDDDLLVLKSVERLLIKNNYKVRVAENGEKGIELIGNEKFDLVISDIQMPGKNGVETIREIRQIVIQKQGRDIPIIFITGFAEMGVELDAEGLGEVILKPFNIDHLIMTVREYL